MVNSDVLIMISLVEAEARGALARPQLETEEPAQLEAQQGLSLSARYWRLKEPRRGLSWSVRRPRNRVWWRRDSNL